MLRVPHLPSHARHGRVYKLYLHFLFLQKLRGARLAPLPTERGAPLEGPLRVFVLAVRVSHQKLRPLDVA